MSDEWEWQLSRSRVAHIWKEQRMVRGRNAGRLMGWRAACGATSAYEANWSLSISDPAARATVLQLPGATVCTECDEIASAILGEES